MATRLELHAKLIAITPKAYYKPPKNTTLTYPCIVYSRNKRTDQYANDKRYFGRQGFQVTVIDTDADSKLPDKILDLPYSQWENEFTNDNLYHTVFTVFI